MTRRAEKCDSGRCYEDVGSRLVECPVCWYMKKPIGRAAPMSGQYCDTDCRGYYEPPCPGDLWPAEVRAETLPKGPG